MVTRNLNNNVNIDDNISSKQWTKLMTMIFWWIWIKVQKCAIDNTTNLSDLRRKTQRVQTYSTLSRYNPWNMIQFKLFLLFPIVPYQCCFILKHKYRPWANGSIKDNYTFYADEEPWLKLWSTANVVVHLPITIIYHNMYFSLNG